MAYADFVTAMMAFFLVMWITGQSPQTKQAIAGYFQDPWGTSSENSAPASLLPSEMHGDVLSLDMPQKLAARQASPGRPTPTASRQRCRRPSRAGRRSARSTSCRTATARRRRWWCRSTNRRPNFRTTAKEQLDKLIPNLVGKLNKIEIRGHSTRRPLPADSPYRDLWQLCYARCLAVMDYFEEHGIEADRLRLSQSAAFEPLTSRIETALAERKLARRGVPARRNGRRTAGHRAGRRSRSGEGR